MMLKQTFRFLFRKLCGNCLTVILIFQIPLNFSENYFWLARHSKQVYNINRYSLTSFKPVFHFFTRWNCQNISIFWHFQEVQKWNVGGFPWISSAIRQKCESQNGCYKKIKHAKFPEKRTFLTPWYARA